MKHPHTNASPPPHKHDQANRRRWADGRATTPRLWHASPIWVTPRPPHSRPLMAYVWGTCSRLESSDVSRGTWDVGNTYRTGRPITTSATESRWRPPLSTAERHRPVGSNTHRRDDHTRSRSGCRQRRSGAATSHWAIGRIPVPSSPMYTTSDRPKDPGPVKRPSPLRQFRRRDHSLPRQDHVPRWPVQSCARESSGRAMFHVKHCAAFPRAPAKGLAPQLETGRPCGYDPNTGCVRRPLQGLPLELASQAYPTRSSNSIPSSPPLPHEGLARPTDLVFHVKHRDETTAHLRLLTKEHPASILDSLVP